MPESKRHKPKKSRGKPVAGYMTRDQAHKMVAGTVARRVSKSDFMRDAKRDGLADQLMREVPEMVAQARADGMPEHAIRRMLLEAAYRAGGGMQYHIPDGHPLRDELLLGPNVCAGCGRPQDARFTAPGRTSVGFGDGELGAFNMESPRDTEPTIVGRLCRDCAADDDKVQQFASRVRRAEPGVRIVKFREEGA